MATLQTLDPFSTKPRENVKVGPQNQVGGGMGFLDEWGEIIRSPQQIAADGGSFITGGVNAIGELLNQTIKETVTEVTGQKFDINGSLTGFQENRAKTPELMQKEAAELRRKGEFFRTTQEDLGKVAMEKGLAESLKAKREEVNKVIGIKNVSYEDTVNEDGTLRTDVAVAYAKKNSELAAEQLNANRQKTVALATGVVKVDLNAVMEGGTGKGSLNISSTGGAGVG